MIPQYSTALVLRLLVGTYTFAGDSKGIYLCALNTETLEWQVLDTAWAENPSYVAVQGDCAYAISESGNHSQVHSLKIEGDTLRLTSTRADQGDDPCHLKVMGDKIYIANYTSGSVVVKHINADGTVGDNVQEFRFDDRSTSPRQEASHMHNVAIAPSGKWLTASNLGGDRIYLFKRHDDGTLTLRDTARVKAGSGPRHMDWAGDERHLYLINELSNDVMVFGFDGTTLTLEQTIVASTAQGHAGDLHLHPSGRWLYGSARNEGDGLILFTVAEDGRVERSAFYATQKHPRNFFITPCGTLLLCACMNSNCIEIFRISPEDGTLTHTGRSIALPKPVCIVAVG